MTKAIQHMFADVAAKLENLHAIAVEGQCPSNAPDMQSVLNAHLRSGLVALSGSVRAMTAVLDDSSS